MKKVLIVSYSFPPFNNIASRRFGEMVEYFEEFGWDPYVLTTPASGDLSVLIDESKVFRVGTKRDSANHKVQAKLNISNFSRLRREKGFYSRLLDSTFNSWFLEFKKSNLLQHIINTNFDLIIASYGPGSALLLGSYISKKTSVPWLADFRDLAALHTEEFRNRNSLVIKADRLLEKYIISSASGVSTVSYALEDEILNNYNLKNSCVIYNGYDNDFITSGSFDSEKYLYYAGRFYSHRMRSVFLVLDFLSTTRKFKLVLRSLGPKSLEDKIIDYAEKLSILDRVQILEPASAQIIKKESKNAYINLVFETLDTSTSWKKGVLTGKLLGLLPYNQPILAVARNDSEIGKVLESTSKGKCVDNLRDITLFFNTLESNYTLYSGDSNKIQEFSKQNQAKKLCYFLNKIVEETS